MSPTEEYLLFNRYLNDDLEGDALTDFEQDLMTDNALAERFNTYCEQHDQNDDDDILDDKNITLFAQYKKGVLPDIEKKDFEKKLINDPNFAKKFDFYAIVSEEVQTVREKIVYNNLKKSFDTYQASQNTPIPTLKHYLWHIASAVAASFLIIFIFNMFFKQKAVTSPEVVQTKQKIDTLQSNRKNIDTTNNNIKSLTVPKETPLKSLSPLKNGAPKINGSTVPNTKKEEIYAILEENEREVNNEFFAIVEESEKIIQNEKKDSISIMLREQKEAIEDGLGFGSNANSIKERMEIIELFQNEKYFKVIELCDNYLVKYKDSNNQDWQMWFRGIALMNLKKYKEAAIRWEEMLSFGLLHEKRLSCCTLVEIKNLLLLSKLNLPNDENMLRSLEKSNLPKKEKLINLYQKKYISKQE